MRAPSLIALALLLGLAAAGARAAPTKLPQQSGVVRLPSEANVLLQGASDVTVSNSVSVASAGDVNGDGLTDVIVGAEFAGNNGRKGSGSAFVVFGREDQATVDLATLGDQGFRIDGEDQGDRAGSSVAGAGDVNGDGLADVIVGDQGVSVAEPRGLGSAYVVFGKASSANVDLAALGEQGFHIVGAVSDSVGSSVAPAGDLNGDGRADLIVTALNFGYPETTYGVAYVVYGKASSTTINLAALGDQGFRIIDTLGEGAAVTGGAAYAGDVNGDGRDDLIVGAHSGDHNGRTDSGSAYLVFGEYPSATVDLATLGNRGFRIDGAVSGDAAGWSVAGAGDVNGDGRADVIVGAALAGNNEREKSGSAYVLYGKASSATVDLAAMGAQGFRIDGAGARDYAGWSVADAGDVNGDGRADVLVGAPFTDFNNHEYSGSAYVVFGSVTRTTVDLASIGDRGVRIDGGGPYASIGLSDPAAAGDVNGDGRADVIVGSDPYRLDGRWTHTSAYIVYGFGNPEVAYDPLAATAGQSVAPHAPKLLRRTGQPLFAVQPALPPGLRLDRQTGVVSGTPLEPQAEATYTVTMTDLVGSVTAALLIAVAPDVTPPTLVVGARSPQRVLRQHGAYLLVSCSEACRLAAAGSVSVAGRRVRSRFGAQPRSSPVRDGQPSSCDLLPPHR